MIFDPILIEDQNYIETDRFKSKTDQNYIEIPIVDSNPLIEMVLYRNIEFGRL